MPVALVAWIVTGSSGSLSPLPSQLALTTAPMSPCEGVFPVSCIALSLKRRFVWDTQRTHGGAITLTQRQPTMFNTLNSYLRDVLIQHVQVGLPKRCLQHKQQWFTASRVLLDGIYTGCPSGPCVMIQSST
jgi:hypothetical protein